MHRPGLYRPLASVAESHDGLRLLGWELHWVPGDAYDRRTPQSLSIRSAGYVDALGRAEERGDVPVWLHTHPGRLAVPRRSEHDELVDDQLQETFRVRSGAGMYASVVASPAGHWFRFTGRVRAGNGVLPIERLLVAGERWSLTSAEDAPRGACCVSNLTARSARSAVTSSRSLPSSASASSGAAARALQSRNNLHVSGWVQSW